MTEYKTIKQEVDMPMINNTLMADADTALNALIVEGWQVENMTYRPWQDGPHDLYMDRYITLKRETPVQSVNSVEPSDWRVLQGEFDSLAVTYHSALNAYDLNTSTENGDDLEGAYAKLIAFLKRLRGQRWYHPHETKFDSDLMIDLIREWNDATTGDDAAKAFDAIESYVKSLASLLPQDVCFAFNDLTDALAQSNKDDVHTAADALWWKLKPVVIRQGYGHYQES